MRLHLAPPALLSLLTTILLTPTPAVAVPGAPHSVLQGFSYAELFGRWECGGTLCGYSSQLCCGQGHACYTNYLTQAACSSGSAAPSHVAGGGHWTYYTRTTVINTRETITTTMSSYINGPSSTARCNWAIGESSCDGKCCGSNEYCHKGTCAPAYPGEETTTATVTTTEHHHRSQTAESGSALPPVRQTSYSSIAVTYTSSPTRTVHYGTPIATGANITVTSYHHSSSLSGGAIAGIVIGVLLAIFILALICFYCCLRGIWDGLLACFGLGRKRRVTETEEYTKRTHYSSDGRKRNWYGAPAKSRREERDSHVTRDLLGLGAGLAGLWAILGLKRRREDRKRKEEQKYQSEYSYSSDYYTSESRSF